MERSKNTTIPQSFWCSDTFIWSVAERKVDVWLHQPYFCMPATGFLRATIKNPHGSHSRAIILFLLLHRTPGVKVCPKFSNGWNCLESEAFQWKSSTLTFSGKTGPRSSLSVRCHCSSYCRNMTSQRTVYEAATHGGVSSFNTHSHT